MSGKVSGPPNGFVDWAGETARPRLAVKDTIGVAGMIQSAGLPLYAQRRAAQDAAVVTRFRDAGFSIAGTTVSDSAGFGTMTPGVKNPRHPGRAVGGSSGGAAAAVAAGRAEVGLGTDAGGSVRIPAAYCDLFAFKATPGRVDNDGTIPLTPSFDALGVMAADPKMLEKAARTLIDWRNPHPNPPSIAIDADALRVADPTVRTPFEAIAARLGITQSVSAAIPYEPVANAHAAIVCIEALAVHGEDWRRDPTGFTPLVRQALRYAKTITASEASVARAWVKAARTAMDRLSADILIGPTLPMPPAATNEAAVVIDGRRTPVTNANIRLTFTANVAGLPVVVAPLSAVSVQFVGRRGEDEALIRTALDLAASYSP